MRLWGAGHAGAEPPHTLAQVGVQLLQGGLLLMMMMLLLLQVLWGLLQCLLRQLVGLRLLMVWHRVGDLMMVMERLRSAKVGRMGIGGLHLLGRHPMHGMALSRNR